MSEALLKPTEILARWDAASAAARSAAEQRLCIAFLGAASAGKDAAIRALFGVDFGQIDPIPGSTDRAGAVLLGDGRVVVVNAPGFGDLRAQVEAEARALIDRLDVAVYLMNCDGGATADEAADLAALRATGRPVLLCLNKIDLIRPHQRAAFVAATLAQLGVSPDADAHVVTAFDPLPALADAPLGVEETIAWLHRTLAQQGKALVLARYLQDRAAACEPILRAAARKAAVAGALPVPGADALAVSAVQVQLISDLAVVFGQRLERDVVLFLLGEVLAASGKGFVRWGMSALKAAGYVPGAQLAELATSAIGATLAGGATYGVGRAAVTFLRARAAGEPSPSGEVLRTFFDEGAQAWRAEQERGAG